MESNNGSRAKFYRVVRIAGVAALILATSGYCASTQRTGRAHYGGETPDEESEFFTPLSENDNSLRKPRRDSRYNNDCRCDLNQNGDNQKTAWNQESSPRRESSYNRSEYNRNDYDNTLPARDLSDSGDFSEVGMASWYGREFDGKKTASGQIFDSQRLTAAHRTLPLGTVIMVKNMDNNKEVVVTINDRGPYVQGRILDISEHGAELLDFKQRGLATVGIKILRKGKGRSRGRGITSNQRAPREAETAFNEPGSDYSGSRSDGGPAVGGSGREDESYYSTGNNTGRSGGTEERRYSDYNDSMGYQDDTRTSERLSGPYSIQVGVFSSRFNATSFRESLGDYGHPVRVIRKGNQFAVVIDGFKNRRSARSVNRRLRDNGYSSFIMR